MIEIRCVQAEDLFSVITLAYETLSERYDPVIFSLFYESFPQGFLVAVNNQKIIGFIVAIPTDNCMIKIVLFSVEEQYRKQKIGSSLLSFLIDTIKTLDIRGIELEVKTSNTSAICFYEKQGFKKIRCIDNFYQTKESAFTMRKDLKF